jgi:hypothetical protein
MRTATVSAQEQAALVPAIVHEARTSVRMFRTKCNSVGGRVLSLLFITIMRFFLKVKSRELTMYDIYDTFDALPFMWLLSSALVKIIDMRTKFHNSENERIQSLRELDRERTQLETSMKSRMDFSTKLITRWRSFLWLSAVRSGQLQPIR